MEIIIQNTDDQVALVRAMGSNDRNLAYEAQAAVTTILGPIVNEVINNAVTIASLFTNLPFSEDDNPSIPLDLYHDITDEDYIRVYSQSVAGGLPTNQMFPSHNELKFTTYTLDSAISFDRKYARKARMDVVGKSFVRLAQEVLLKREKTAFNTLATALILASTKVGGSAGGAAAAGNHIIATNTENVLTLHDFNRLVTRSKRINTSFSSGTPVSGSRVGITDLMVSPEMIQEIRSMAYQPVNTRTVDGTTGTPAGSSTAMPAHESLRESLFSSAGIPQFYGISIMEVLELGVNQRFNTIFAAIDAANSTPAPGGGGSGNFTQADDEILIGVDRGRSALLRPVVVEEGQETEMTLLVDDQFVSRANKVGWYGRLQEGHIVTNDRVLTGLVC